MPPTVLIIDDNVVIREILRHGLEARGWDVAEATDAFTGLAAFRKLSPRLVTLDLIMPINNGLDSIHVAQTIAEQHPDVTLFIFSALSAESEIIRFFGSRSIELFDKSHPRNSAFVSLFRKADLLLQRLNNENRTTAGRVLRGSTKWTH